MVVYSDLIGTTLSESTTFEEMTGSPYSPLTNGSLIQLKLYMAGSDAASLIENVLCKVTSVSFGGIPVFVAASGAGLRTAPSVPIPVGITNCDLPVRTGVTVKAEFRNVTADTPVTVEGMLIGVFRG